MGALAAAGLRTGKRLPCWDGPQAEKRALEAEHCDPAVREPFIAALVAFCGQRLADQPSASSPMTLSGPRVSRKSAPNSKRRSVVGLRRNPPRRQHSGSGSRRQADHRHPGRGRDLEPYVPALARWQGSATYTRRTAPRRCTGSASPTGAIALITCIWCRPAPGATRRRGRSAIAYELTPPSPLNTPFSSAACWPFQDDREGYTEAKAEFINQALKGE